MSKFRSASDYEAAAATRRTTGWAPSTGDINTLVFQSVDTLRSRSRDMVRRNPWATNALDAFIGNCIGTGIRPQSQHPDVELKEQIQALWLKWTDEAGASGLTDSYFGDFVKPCRKYGVAPGVFLSCHRNGYQKVWSHKVNWGAGGEGQAAFAHIGEKMTQELVSRYGPLCEVWYDAGLLAPSEGRPDVMPIIDRYQPDTVFYHSPQRRDHRWIGNESGFAGEPCWDTMPDLRTADNAHRNSAQNRGLLLHCDPQGSLWSPGMVDVPIRDHNWFWPQGEDGKLFQPQRLVEMYYQSVGRNCTFITGAVVNQDGLIPDADVRVYTKFGNAIRRRFAHPIAETAGQGRAVELRLPRPARFNHVVLMEDSAQGERVRAYTVEAQQPDGAWQSVASGESIGHQWIHRCAPVEAQLVRLRITSSTAPPVIRSFALYEASTGGTLA